MTADYVQSLDTNKAWNYGWVGKLTTLPAIIIKTVGSIVGGLATAVGAKMIVFGVCVSVIGLSVVAILVLIRRHRVTWMNSDRVLHDLMHQTRDQIQKIKTCSISSKKSNFDLLNQNIVNSVAEYFRTRLHDNSITCCLRLASSDDVQGETFETVARSTGMEAIRSSNTQPISATEGIAKALLDKNIQGVFLIQDIEKAKSNGWWQQMPNDSLHDVNTMMLAPINGWEDTNKVMLGILFVCSKKRVFQPSHSLPLKAIVDSLGSVFPSLVNKSGQGQSVQVEIIEQSNEEGKE